MMTELMVGDVVVYVKGFKCRIGRRYKVLSITLTDVYLQDVITNRCHNQARYLFTNRYVKVNQQS